MFKTLSFVLANDVLALAAVRRRGTLSRQLPCWLTLCAISAVLAALAAIAATAVALALGCRGSTVVAGGSTAQLRAARPDVTWSMCNVRRLGPCERSEQGPRRRALHIDQVTSG